MHKDLRGNSHGRSEVSFDPCEGPLFLTFSGPFCGILLKIFLRGEFQLKKKLPEDIISVRKRILFKNFTGIMDISYNILK